MRKLRIVRQLRKLQFRLQISFYKKRGKQIVHFLHIGKTAGTSIKSAFNYHYLTVTDTCVFVLHNHGTYLTDIPKDEKVFFVVRDPLTRFVSGFYSRLREGMPRIYNPWKPEEKIAFELFKTPNELGEALSSSDKSIKESAKKALQNIGHVRSSYWRWVKSPEYLHQHLECIFWIGCQENLSNDFEKLKKKGALNIDLPKEKAHASPSHFDSTLSDLARQNLTEWYKAEYDFLAQLYKYKLIEFNYNENSLYPNSSL